MKKPKSNKTKIIIIIIAIFIVLVALAIVLPLCLIKKKDKIVNFFSKDKRTLNYYPEQYGNNFFSIVETSNYFKLIEKNQPFCYRAPCNPTIKKTKEIKDKEEIKNLTFLFDELFNNTNEKEKRIQENELTYEQKEIINTIFKNNEIFIPQLKYEILNDTIDYDSKYSKRGYYIEKMNNDSVIVTIALGLKNTNGYSIRIKDIRIEMLYVSIKVEETSPGVEQIISNITTYPCTKIKFDKEPTELSIKNDNYEFFEEVEI